MADARADIEAIVGEVMRRLRSADSAAAAEGAAPAPPPRPALAPSAAPGQLVIEQRVVAWAAIRDRLDGVRCVVVRPDAVVTPSVRDELRRRDIPLVRDSAARAENPSGAPELLIGAAGAAPTADALLRGLDSAGVRVERIEAGSLAETLRMLIPRVAAGRSPAMLLTDQPAAALCAANRNCGVRAAGASDAASAASSAQAIGANLLVIDPAGRSLHELKRIAIQLARTGRRDCPAPLDQLLNKAIL